MKQIARLAVAAVLVAWATGNARASITPSYEDGGKTMVLDVAEDDMLDIAIPSTVTNLVKTGDGKATLTQAAAWTAANCTVEVRGGTLAPGTYANMGAPATVTVLPGATLDFTGFAKDLYASSYVKTIFYVSGNGFDGAGALRYTDTSKKCHALLKRIVMTGDTKVFGPKYSSTLIGADNGFGFGPYKSGSYGNDNPRPCLDMNGHTLTIEGSFCFGNSSVANGASISNPGDIVLLANARLLLPSLANLTVTGTGTATWPNLNGKTITLNNGAQMFHYMMRDAQTLTWKVMVPENATSRFVLHGNNDKSRAYVYYPFEVEGTLYLNETDKSTYSMRLLSGLTGGGKVISESKVGTNRATTEGVMRFDTLSGHSYDRQMGELSVTCGTLDISNLTVNVTNIYKASGTLYGTAATIIGGAEYDRFAATLRLAGDTHFSGGDNQPTKHAIMVGCDKYGILDVSGGATVSNMIYMARKNGDYGAVWLSGAQSENYWPSTSSSRSLIGDEGYGCMMMADGKVTITGANVLLGRNGGSGYWVQTNGTTTVYDNPFWLGRPHGSDTSSADLHVSGGLFDARNKIRLLYPDSGSNWKNARAVVTVGGGTVPATIQTTDLEVYTSTNLAGAAAIVNVNSNGTLKAKRVGFVMSPNGALTAPEKTSPETRFYLNFNGGTLVFAADTAHFSYSAARVPHRTVVYEGGAVLDTAGHDVGFDAALIRPQGKGIASLALPAAQMDTNECYIGASRIYANTESGWSFTGLTCFNPSRRSVEGAVVTCPGYDLPDDDAFAVNVLSRMRNARACTFTLADLPTTGGVTKKGAGTLTLQGANTYGGTTRVEAGTLAFAAAGGYPGGDLEIPAAALTTNGVAFVTAVDFALATGRKIRITGAETLDSKTFGKARTLVSTTAAMSPDLPTKLELVDSAGVAMQAPVWKLNLNPSGTALTFGASRGVVVIMR
ncbi:MAG: autotransporter-associated beta strand repeat-containing protein [Kiritimatiellae bacterium]|nr:autotransporter-associated beta strand repeat-containing protein [Kiritimatiellia bacterium]